MHGKIPCLIALLYYASRIWLFPPSSSLNQEMQSKKSMYNSGMAEGLEIWGGE